MKRNQLLIGGAALLAIVLFWYFVLYAPLGDDLSSAQAQVAAEQKTTDDLNAKLAQLQSQAKNAPQQQALLRKLDAAVPKQPDLAEFIIMANDIADQSGISFLSISPSPPAAGTGATVINLTISIGGSFFQLQDYLRLLEKLERLVIVDGVTISAGAAGGTTGTSGSTGSTSVDTSSSGDGTSLSVTLASRMFTRAAPAGAADGSSTTTPGATTPTTTPGATTTTVPAAGSSTTGGT